MKVQVLLVEGAALFTQVHGNQTKNIKVNIVQ